MTEPLLVSTSWLEDHLQDSNMRIVDVRGHVLQPGEDEARHLSHRPAYLEGHIPGAVFLDWIDQLSDDPNHLRVASPPDFAQAMGNAGIDVATHVIAYDDAGGRLAARLWWALRYYGHPHVSVLDGGWNKWRAEERPVSDVPPRIEPAHFTPGVQAGLLRQGQDVLHMLKSNRVLVDMRSQREFTGETTLTRLAGHIPGAVNLPVSELTRPDGTFHSPDELRRRFTQVGIDGSEPEVVFYSSVGVDACLGLLALHVAGFEHGSVYDTSWQEWGNDETKPIESLV